MLEDTRLSPGFVVICLLVSSLAVSGGVVADAGHPDLGVNPQIHVEPSVRSSIKIEGDAALANHSAVRAGNGSMDNPYRIEGWFVVQDDFYGLWVANVSSHVIIEDIIIDGSKSGETANARCESPFDPCRFSRGVFLNNVSNVMVQNLQVQDALKGVLVYNSGEISLQNTTVGLRKADVGEPEAVADAVNDLQFSQFGIDVTNADRLVLANVTANHAALPVVARDVTTVGIRDSTIASPGGDGIRLLNVNSFSMERSSLSAARLRVKGSMSDLSVSRSSFVDGGAAFSVDSEGEQIGSAMFCGNHFANMTNDFGTIIPSRVTEVQIMGNEFEDVAAGIAATSAIGWEGTIRRNLITNVSHRALFMNGNGLEVHNNTIENNSLASVLAGTIDASQNWWGSPSGPSIEGPGTGDPLYLDDNVTIRPWLTSAPEVGPTAVVCDVPNGPPGVKRGFLPSVHAQIGASISLDHTISPAHAKVHENAKIGPFKVKAHENVTLGPFQTRASVNESVSHTVGPIQAPT